MTQHSAHRHDPALLPHNLARLMDSIDFQHRTRLIFAQNSLERLGELARELGAGRALVVSDPGVVAAGHLGRGLAALRGAGLEVAEFLDVRENPSTVEVAAGVAVAKDYRPDLLIAIGGGSSMDCAKGINFIYSCGGRMEDYWGVGKATGEMLPMIAVPTTAGTGSEAQSFALISQAETHVKMACGDPRAACRVAVLDPLLTLTQPPRVTALTGIDALSHALESHVTSRRNSLSACYSRQAWQLLSRGLPQVLSEPHNVMARGEVQLGAFFAGMAIETSMLGAAHALANPLTARYGITHGQAVGMMLPAVIRFNGMKVEALYAELWRDVAAEATAQAFQRASAADSLAAFVHHLVSLSGLQTNLAGIGVPADDVPQLAREATKQWTGTFNPRSLSEADFQALYQGTLAKAEL